MAQRVVETLFEVAVPIVGRQQGGSVTVLIVLAERGMAVRVSDFGDSPEQIVLIKRLLAVGGRIYRLLKNLVMLISLNWI